MKQVKKLFGTLFIASLVLISSSGCSSLDKTMREPNVRVELRKTDFTLSEQVSAEAKSVKLIGIDFKRIFTKRRGTIESSSAAISFANIPVIGPVLTDRTSNYALYELMQNNPGYDVIFYPQFETKVVRPVFGLGFIFKITTVRTTARLGKL